MPGLLALLPELKAFHEELYVYQPAFERLLVAGDDKTLRRIFGEDCRAEIAIRHYAVSPNILHHPKLFLVNFLYCDLKTRAHSTKMISYAAVRKVGREKLEHLWHGFALTTNFIRDSAET